MVKTIYFVRHGLSEGNANKTYQTVDTLLDVRGKEQAQKIAERLIHLPIELVLSSDAARAKHTAEIIVGQINKPLVLSPLLRERKRPIEIENKKHDDPDSILFNRQALAAFGDPNKRFSDQENFWDLKARARQALDFVISQKVETVAVVTHGGFLRFMILEMFLGDQLTPEIYLRSLDFLNTKNTGLTWCDIGEDGWRLRTWNDHAHLAE